MTALRTFLLTYGSSKTTGEPLEKVLKMNHNKQGYSATLRGYVRPT